MTSEPHSEKMQSSSLFWVSISKRIRIITFEPPLMVTSLHVQQPGFFILTVCRSIHFNTCLIETSLQVQWPLLYSDHYFSSQPCADPYSTCHFIHVTLIVYLYNLLLVYSCCTPYNGHLSTTTSLFCPS